jgi:hypothetical protein
MLRHEFAELARTLQLSPKREEARFGEILAMSVPSPRLDSVYWIADQPVSTCWGTTQASRELTAAELVRDGPVNEPALRGFDAPQIEAVRPAAPPAPALRREERPIPAWLRLASLAREVWRRPVWLLALPLLALAALLLACLATARPRLLIPLDAPTTAELSFLVGRWRVSNPWFETDSQDVGLVHLPLRVEYWFGSEGVGEHRVQRANGEVCKGPAFAVFTETGALRIETERTQCTREAFRPEVVLCMRATETTRCVQDDSDRDGGDDLILERVLTLGSSGLAACDLCGWLSWRDRGP